MICARLTLPAARAYADLVGARREDAELERGLERRLRAAPLLARLAACAGALFLRFAAPPLLLARWTSFERLSAAQRDALLGRLQRSDRPSLRALFLAIKPLILAACYGREELTAHAGL